jgi:hypothetical protein
MLGLALLLEIYAGWANRPRLELAWSDGAASAVPPPDQTSLPTPPGHELASHAQPPFFPSRSPFQPAASPAPLPSLAGIIITSRQRLGIFRIGDGTPAIIQVGCVVGAFRLLSITADSARIRGPFGISTLQMAFDRDPPQASSPTLISSDESAAFPGANSWPRKLAVSRD